MLSERERQEYLDILSFTYKYRLGQKHENIILFLSAVLVFLLTFLCDELPNIFLIVLALLPLVFLEVNDGVAISVCVPFTCPLAFPTA